jgi:hypothetical protein
VRVWKWLAREESAQRRKGRDKSSRRIVNGQLKLSTVRHLGSSQSTARPTAESGSFPLRAVCSKSRCKEELDGPSDVRPRRIRCLVCLEPAQSSSPCSPPPSTTATPSRRLLPTRWPSLPVKLLDRVSARVDRGCPPASP